MPQRRLHAAAHSSFDLGWSQCILPAYLYSRPAACIQSCIPSRRAPIHQALALPKSPHCALPNADRDGTSAAAPTTYAIAEAQAEERTLPCAPGLKTLAALLAALRTAVPARAAAAFAEATAALGERGCAAAFALRSSTGVVMACAAATPRQRR